MNSRCAMPLPPMATKLSDAINIEFSIGGKWLALAAAAAARRIAMIYNPPTAPFAGYYLLPFEAAGPAYGMQASAAAVDSDVDIVAEFERELIPGRTGEGRKRAKDRGVRFGRPRKLTAHQRREALGDQLARPCIVVETGKAISRGCPPWNATG